MNVNHNGIIQDAEHVHLGIQNRSFRYGDALFETLRMFDGQLPFWESHWDRLHSGAQYLRFQHLNDSFFYKNEIHRLCESGGNWRIRLSLYRKDGGLYTPDQMETAFLIEATPINDSQFVLNKKGLKTDICDTVHVPSHPLSNLKTSNSLIYVLASIFKKEKQLDDCLLLNEVKAIVEASSSNIFFIRKNLLYTPPLSSGCIDGTMRRIILRQAPQLNLIPQEQYLASGDIANVDEIWLTNATQGIRWVGSLQDHSYKNEKAKEAVVILNSLIKEE